LKEGIFNFYGLDKWLILFCCLCCSIANGQDRSHNDEELIHTTGNLLELNWQNEKEALYAPLWVNINKANEAELRTLGITDEAVQSILDYRKNFGNFTSIEQLQGLDGWDPLTLEHLLPYLTIGTPTEEIYWQAFRYPKHYQLAAATGYSNSGNGYSQISNIRFKVGNPSSLIRYGLQLRRSYSPSKTEHKGSFYLQVKNTLYPKIPINQVTIGHYRPDIGLGLNLGGNAGFAPWLGLAGRLYFRKETVVPWQSAYSNYALQGLAVSGTINTMQYISWLHINTQPTTTTNDTVNNLAIRPLGALGTVIQPGVLLNHAIKNGSIFGTYFQNGDEYQTGLGVTINSHNLTHNIEAGFKTKDAALLYSVFYPVNKRITLTTSGRAFSKNWQNSLGNPYAQSSSLGGEKGWYSVIQYEQSRTKIYWFTTDIYQNTRGLTFTQPAIHANFSQQGSTTINASLQTPISKNGVELLGKLAITKTLSETFTLAFLVNLRKPETTQNGKTTIANGYATELRYHKNRHQLRVRVTVWSAPEFRNAIYLPEPDIQFFNRTIAAYEVGNRIGILYRYQLAQGTIWESKIVVNQLTRTANRSPLNIELRTGVWLRK
jgi:hypothetical protein